jgi:hypothetical protein
MPAVCRALAGTGLAMAGCTYLTEWQLWLNWLPCHSLWPSYVLWPAVPGLGRLLAWQVEARRKSQKHFQTPIHAETLAAQGLFNLA